MPRPWTETAHYRSFIDPIEADLIARGFKKVAVGSKLKARQYYRTQKGEIDGDQSTTYTITWQLERGERRR